MPVSSFSNVQNAMIPDPKYQRLNFKDFDAQKPGFILPYSGFKRKLANSDFGNSKLMVLPKNEFQFDNEVDVYSFGSSRSSSPIDFFKIPNSVRGRIRYEDFDSMNPEMFLVPQSSQSKSFMGVGKFGRENCVLPQFNASFKDKKREIDNKLGNDFKNDDDDVENIENLINFKDFGLNELSFSLPVSGKFKMNDTEKLAPQSLKKTLQKSEFHPGKPKNTPATPKPEVSPPKIKTSENKTSENKSSKNKTSWSEGDSVEIKHDGIWYPGKIEKLDKSKKGYMVHFTGWNKNTDEFIRFENSIDEIRDREEVKKRFELPGNLEIGSVCIAKYPDGKEYSAKILKFSEKSGQCEVVYTMDGVKKTQKWGSYSAFKIVNLKSIAQCGQMNKKRAI
jgi:ribonuclease BN (tRNA processing enzyme)